jgi:hypothetical protein
MHALLTALGAGLHGIGIPKKSILEYETSLRKGNFMLVAHGTPGEIVNACIILDRAKGVETHLHMDESTAMV